MSRSFSSRVFALGGALWFCALATNLPGLHSCPAHDSLGADALSQRAHAPAVPGGHDHHAAHEHDEAPARHDGDCTCVGSGCCSITISLPAAITVGVAVATFDPFVAVPVERAAPARPTPDHALPPAIGPPALPTSL